MKRKICIFTGTRAEYGLLKPLMDEIMAGKNLEMQTLVSGMHLSPEFGLTYKVIESDGFLINKKVEILMSSDSGIGVAKSTGLGIMGYAEAFSELTPDIVVILGDRFESFAAAAAASILNIPIAHLYGGEVTEGAFDDAFRHSITKMSHLHFTSTEVYRKRVIQLGESPESVFNVGALGLENIRRLPLMTREEFKKKSGFTIAVPCILVTFHPVTRDSVSSAVQFGNLLDAIGEIDGLHLIFTKANADTEGRAINRMIDEYVAGHDEKAVAFASMGQLQYLSAMKHVDAVVGNSSSGIIEAPTLGVPTVNIGDRQKGRVKAESVIDCPPVKDAIVRALRIALSPEFRLSAQGLKNPYEKNDTAKTILEILKHSDLDNICKKRFYDISDAIR